MRSLIVVLLTLSLFLGAVVVVGQNPKQELNDQFYEAVRKGDLALVTSLLDKGVDVNSKFRYGATALFKAAERGHLEIVKLLLARGADVTVKDTFYQATAMTWALSNGHIEIVSALLDKQPESVDGVLLNGLGNDKPDLVKVALAKGGLKKETLTTALFIASADKDKAELVEILKKAGAIPPPEVKAETLQSYAGKYRNQAGLELTMAVTNGRLTGAAGQRPLQLLAVDDINFRVALAEGMSVRFKIEEGKVTGLTLTQGPTKTEFTRVAETK
jgi:ankyrin repeat protein